MSELRVTAYRSLEALAPWRDALDALVLASPRGSPFHTVEYLAAFLADDEYAPADSEPLLLVARDDDRPVGFLALRRRTDRGFGRRRRIELLTTHDMAHPGLVARAEDEARCAAAFIEYLQRRERGWSFLELREQEAGSALAELPGLDRRRYRVRTIRNNPSTVVELAGTSYDDWLARIRSNHWRRFCRRVRSLLGAGHVEFVACEGRAPALALLDLYLELEARSWKVAARAGIARHPRRLALFRRMVQLETCDAPLFHFVLLDGVPIAGLLSLRNAGVAYGMETAFDERCARFAPGNLLFLLVLRDAYERGLRALDLLSNYAYYKSQWGATVTESQAVQAYRRFSRYHLRATIGELRRRLFGAAPQQNEATHNLARTERPPSVEAERDDQPLALDDAASRREHAARVLADASRTARVVHLAGESLLAALPPDIAARRSTSKRRPPRSGRTSSDDVAPAPRS